MMRSASTTLVTVPSPLEGEGMKLLQRPGLGEGASSLEMLFRRKPRTHHSLLNDLPALSLKGRGRNNAHLACGEAAS